MFRQLCHLQGHEVCHPRCVSRLTKMERSALIRTLTEDHLKPYTQNIQRLHTTQRYQKSNIRPSVLVHLTLVIYSTCLFTLLLFLTLLLIPSLLWSRHTLALLCDTEQTNCKV